MRLISCRLRNIRRHRDLALHFGREITLITGANETGKSTLVEALHKGLFLRATATGRGVEELRSRLHPGLPELEIRFEAAAEDWTLRKRFAGSSGTCQLSNGRGVALSGAAAEEQLAALLGFEAPVEGRRIAQLPERWAHLWVRQGDAGLNPIGAGQTSYDHNRLLEQLQQTGPQEALESGLDRRVLERIQQRVAELYTATGRIRAGSSLAEAKRRSEAAAEALLHARQQLADLETAMEQWRRINERLETIDNQQLPRLQRELALLQQTRLLQARLEPLLRQAREQHDLLEQQQRERQQQQAEQLRLEALLQQQQQQQREQQQAQQQQQTLQQQQHLQQQRLDLLQLSSEAAQLQEHQRQMERLQRDAEGLKQQLAALPQITAAQVKQLRQAEQELAQAATRCEAMAASLEVLHSDQSLLLNGDALQPGDRRLIQAPARLEVGAGVVLQLAPGGGEALPQALEQREQCQQHLQQLQQALQLPNSDVAETIERQRHGLERELSNLRQAARSIPWSGLQQRLAQLEPQRLRLQQALAEHADLMELDRADPQASQEALRSAKAQLAQEHEVLSRRLQELERDLQQSQRSVDLGRTRLAQLDGSLTVIAQRLELLQQQQPADDALKEQQQQLQELLEDLQLLRGARDTDPALEIQALEEEKAQLLNQRGQAEQRCSSLGAVNPAAAVDQCQAAWDDAEAERCDIEQRGQALLLLQERFHRAQSDLASRYSTPLRDAITPYLAALNADPQQPLLDFDPQRGFHDLQLRQAGESFAFERLSGGMREQLAAAVRLAIAEVLKPAYNDVLPLVFDDAFTNSDRQRLSGLKRMLQRGMDQGVQIVLLSCHPDDYADLIPTDTTNPPDALGGMKGLSVSLS